MGIMPDSWIKKMSEEKRMIDPFVEKLVKKKCSVIWLVILWLRCKSITRV